MPATPDYLLRLLRERHAILLQARKTKNPGEFKDKNNRAGTTEVVDKELVPGTIKRGFDWYSLLQHPFARAADMIFMISEVHPFLDGNRRIARVMMNAEVSVKGMAKIIIPTVYREDYMDALKKLTKQRDADAIYGYCSGQGSLVVISLIKTLMTWRNILFPLMHSSRTRKDI